MGYNETPTTKVKKMPTMITETELSNMLRRAEIVEELGFTPSNLLLDEVKSFMDNTRPMSNTQIVLNGRDLILAYELASL